MSLTVSFGAALAEADTVSIMSYNIRNARGMDEKTDYKRLADVILRESPDIVAVQEIDSVTGRSKGVDVLRKIADITKMYGVFGAAIDFDGGKYGIGILSKEQPLSHYSVALPGREELRRLLVVEFEKYVVGCVHLSLNAEDRLLSAEIIRREAAKSNKPFFLAGDLNDTAKSGLIKNLKEDFLILNNPENPTFPADTPKTCIDFIFYYTGKGGEKPFTVLSDRVIDEGVASDHRPVAVEIRF
ncbi:MAG: endonuclease/exonuclease/phosphatase family protein [Tannerella sp.]|nr:endonuclease/exonuclease/phosphatase family protein [Tannerella sp.]